MIRTSEPGARSRLGFFGAFLLAALLLVVPKEVSGVQFSSDEVSLDELVGMSSHIVVAKPIGNVLSARAPKNAFDGTVFKFSEILWTSDPDLKARSDRGWQVKPANEELENAIREQIAQHGYQGVPSPSVKAFPSSLSEEDLFGGKKLSFDRAEPAILFLKDGPDGGFRLACEGAFEAVGKKAEVMEAIRRVKQPKVATEQSRPHLPGGPDAHFDLYDSIRNGASVYVARVARATVHPMTASAEKVDLEARITETLWGKKPVPETFKVEFERFPENSLARVKFLERASSWDFLALEPGSLFLLVAWGLPPNTREKDSVARIDDAQDPVLVAIRALLRQEQEAGSGGERVRRYVRWLSDGPTVQKLFASMALAKEDLPQVDKSGDVARVFVRVFDGTDDDYLRITVGQAVLSGIYPKSNPEGQLVIINTMLRRAEMDAKEFTDFYMGPFLNIAPKDLARAGIAANSRALTVFQGWLSRETDPGERARVQRVIAALSRLR